MYARWELNLPKSYSSGRGEHFQIGSLSFESEFELNKFNSSKKKTAKNPAHTCLYDVVDWKTLFYGSGLKKKKLLCTKKFYSPSFLLRRPRSRVDTRIDSPCDNLVININILCSGSATTYRRSAHNGRIVRIRYFIFFFTFPLLMFSSTLSVGRVIYLFIIIFFLLGPFSRVF